MLIKLPMLRVFFQLSSETLSQCEPTRRAQQVPKLLSYALAERNRIYRSATLYNSQDTKLPELFNEGFVFGAAADDARNDDHSFSYSNWSDDEVVLVGVILTYGWPLSLCTQEEQSPEEHEYAEE